MPGRMRSRNSTTVTSAPSRRHTEPSSSPITPAPTTSSCSGTSSSASAPVEETMRFSSIVDARQRRDVGAGGDDDVLGLQRLRLAVVALDLDLAGRGDAARADNRVDLVLLEQEFDALDVAADPLVLERHHRGKIELRRCHADAQLGEAVPGLVEQLGGMQQRLGRNAADIEAGAAEGRALLDHGDLQAELRRADGADIAAGAAADDDEIVGHDANTFLRHARPCAGHPRLSLFKETRRGWPGQARP